ncbi:MAG: hypothetical protein RR405_04175, partial [Clostridia bacterium]
SGAIAGKGAGDAQTVATAGELPKPEGGDPNLAGAYVNIFSNAFAIEVTAGFIKLIVGLLVKTDSQAITDMLPNFKVYAKANLHPYALVIGAVLFNKDGTKAMLDFNIKLNGFNGDENSSKIDFGSEETFLKREAEQIKNNDPNYIFYYANFENGKGDYAKVNDKKYFEKVNAGTGDYIKSDSQFVEITADRQQPFGKAKADAKPYDGIVYIPDPNTPGSFIPLDDGKHTYDGNFRKLAGINNIVNNQYVETATWHNYTSGLYIVNPITQEYEYVSRLSLLGFQGMQYKRIETKNPEGEVTAVTYEPLAWKDEHDNPILDKEGNLIPGLAANLAATKTYKKVNDFANYSKVANINLNSLISDISSGKPLDVASLLGELNTAEVGLKLDLSVTLKDVINWTYQMSKFAGTSAYNYLNFIVSALEGNAEYAGTFGLGIELKAYVNIQKILSGDTNIANLLGGSKIYLDISYISGLHPDKAAGHLKIWIEIDEGGVAHIFLDGTSFADVVGLGSFLGKLKLDLNLATLLTKNDAKTTAISAGDNEDANTGLLPANIWSIMNLILGRLLIANDFLTIGLNENILSALVLMFAPGTEMAEFLPALRTTLDEHTSGITLKLAGNHPELALEIGFMAGYENYLSMANFASDGKKDGVQDETKHQGIDYFGKDWTGDVYKVALDGKGNVIKDKNGKATYTFVSRADYEADKTADKNTKYFVMISNKEYALVDYAYPTVMQGDKVKTSWQGDTYNLDATGKLVLVERTWTVNATGIWGEAPIELNGKTVSGKVVA